MRCVRSSNFLATLPLRLLVDSVQSGNLDVAVSGTCWTFFDTLFAFVANVRIDAIPAADALDSLQWTGQLTC